MEQARDIGHNCKSVPTNQGVIESRCMTQCEFSHGVLLCVWLQLMALLLLRHALAMAAAGASGGDTSTFFTVSVYLILTQSISSNLVVWPYTVYIQHS